MDGYRHILVGTDGSSDAMAAVEAAIRFARAFGVPLVVISAWPADKRDRPPEAEWTNEEAYLRAKRLTEEATALAHERDVTEVERLEPAGNAAEQLLVAAEERPDSLLVVGSSGLNRTIERVVGNVAHQLTHHSPVDLLLVSEHGGRPWETIAAATDGSTTATRAVHRGVAVARALGVVPRIVTVARDEEEARWALSAVTTSLADTEFEQEVIEGSSATPAKHLIEASAGYDLLVIGNRGMSGPSRLLGSVSNRVTHEMPTDLLLVNTRG